MLANYPSLIIERIVPHRSTRGRGGGNHPFVWVSVCNDFSFLLPPDLHVAYLCVFMQVCVCVVVYYCWALANEPSFHMSGRQKRAVLSPLVASSDSECSLLCVSEASQPLHVCEHVFFFFFFPSTLIYLVPEPDSSVFHRQPREASNFPIKTSRVLALTNSHLITDLLTAPQCCM